MSAKNLQGESATDPMESFPPEVAVQLTTPLRRKAEEMAVSEGISLEDFILYAVAEKIARSETPRKS
jgi:predicted nucleic acid-binding protein